MVGKLPGRSWSPALLALAMLGAAISCGRSEIFPRFDNISLDGGPYVDAGDGGTDAGDGGQDAGQDAGCMLSVLPSLDLGDVPFPATSTQSVILTNSGGGTCDVSQIGLGPGTDSLFSIPAFQPTAFLLPAGGNASIAVTFSASTMAAPLHRTGSLTFATNDPEHPSVTVLLSATIQVGCLVEILPPSLDLGTVTYNLSATGKVVLTNAGDTPCNISQVALGAGSDPLFSVPGGTFTIAPGGTAAISVKFVGTDAAAPHQRTGTLTFETSDILHPNAMVPLTATINTACVDDRNWIFTLGLDGTLATFDPVNLKFDNLAQVTCTGAGGSFFSMAVDQNGELWAVDDSGLLWRFDPTATPVTCEPTGYPPGQQGIQTFGMEFLFQPATSADTLYVAGGPLANLGGGPSTLATIATSSLVLTTIGVISTGWIEPAATPDGELWGFAPAYETDAGIAALARIDPASGNVLTTFQYPSVTAFGAFAMKFFQGSFWIFVGDSVFKVDHATGALTTELTNSQHQVVGAGYSQCPPAP